MSKRLAQHKAHRKRPAQVVQGKRIMPINQETVEIIAQQRKFFREHFGREPVPEDPLFFDPGDPTPQSLGDAAYQEVWKRLLQAAGDSGIDPAIVYAMNKTGRIVTETNMQFLTDAELQEWNDAVDEYHQTFTSLGVTPGTYTWK